MLCSVVLTAINRVLSLSLCISVMERHPIFICYVLCGDDGEPDLSSKHIIAVPRTSNITEMIAKFRAPKDPDTGSLDDDDDEDVPSVRVWEKTVKTKEGDGDGDGMVDVDMGQEEGGNDADNEDEQQDDEWSNIFANNEEEDNAQNGDNEDNAEIADNAENGGDIEMGGDNGDIPGIPGAAENEENEENRGNEENGGNEENAETDVLPSYEEVAPAEDGDANGVENGNNDEVEFEWILLGPKACKIPFGQWAQEEDLSSSIRYMIETRCTEHPRYGQWKRMEEWRKNVPRDFDVDIYDKSMNSWYKGQVVEIGTGDHEGEVKVHYEGYAPKYDEWHNPLTSDYIAPLHTHTEVERTRTAYTGSYGYARTSYGYGGSYSWNNDDETPPEDLGCVGLRNLGNTCFMNSTIQCLSHCPEFVQYFLKGVHENEINRDNPLGWNGKVAETWAALLTKYWSGKYSVISPNKIKSTIAEIQPRFSGYQQHDSSELLQFLLDGLHEDLNRIIDKPYTEKVESNDANNDEQIAQKAWTTHKLRNDSVVVDLIQGQLKSRIKCPDCTRISVTFDPFMFLSVPLPTEKKFVTKTITVVWMVCGLCTLIHTLCGVIWNGWWW